PQGHEFIVTVLRAWRNGQVVCPLEPEQKRLEFTALPKACVHLKTTSATGGAARVVAFKAEQLAADAENIGATMGLRRGCGKSRFHLACAFVWVLEPGAASVVAWNTTDTFRIAVAAKRRERSEGCHPSNAGRSSSVVAGLARCRRDSGERATGDIGGCAAADS